MYVLHKPILSEQVLLSILYVIYPADIVMKQGFP